PYGCEFCTVTGFFGDSIRFRSNKSVVDELLRLKARCRKERGQIAVFFIDDNFAINIKRTKSLLRDIIAAGAQMNWIAQISANLLRDEELIDLIAASGGKWIFIAMESIEETHAEVQHAWASSYSAEAIERAVDAIDEKSIGYRINMFIARLCFRGIYFPQMGKLEWIKLFAQNRRTIFKLIAEGFGKKR